MGDSFDPLIFPDPLPLMHVPRNRDRRIAKLSQDRLICWQFEDGGLELFYAQVGISVDDSRFK